MDGNGALFGTLQGNTREVRVVLDFAIYVLYIRSGINDSKNQTKL